MTEMNRTGATAGCEVTMAVVRGFFLGDSIPSARWDSLSERVNQGH